MLDFFDKKMMDLFVYNYINVEKHLVEYIIKKRRTTKGDNYAHE